MPPTLRFPLLREHLQLARINLHPDSPDLCPWPDVAAFSRQGLAKPLRGYQMEIAQAICESVERGLGRALVVVMPRQSGKNEISAQVEAYLLGRCAHRGGQIVKAAPTFRPQAVNSMLRLAACLDAAYGRQWRRPHPYVHQLRGARALFLSAQPTANVVGATADLLLECDEAQEIAIPKWDKDFAPMAASSNATRVFYGTMWTSRTLLAREIRLAQELERRDGAKRVFLVPWEAVAAEVPAYGDYVRQEIARLGIAHPMIRTQYLLQEIDAEAGMFPLARQAQMRGDHPPQEQAEPGGLYALLVDVAGEEAGGADLLGQGDWLRAAQPRRDSTALTVVRVDTGSVATLGLPTYRVVHRRWWTGVKHTDLYGALLDLARHVWRAQYVVVDATGLGAGLASFLARALGERVIPQVFSSRTKSDLGWGFLSIVDTGRFKDHITSVDDAAQAQFWREVAAAEYQVLPGPNKLMRWGVADPALHDDFLISAALCHALDQLPWRYETTSAIIPGRDVLT